MASDEALPPSVVALNDSLKRLESAQIQLERSVSEVNSAVKDVNQAVKVAKTEVSQLAKDQVRKMLAKEFERAAQDLRERK